MFEAELSWWTGTVTLKQPFEATAPDFTIDLTLRYSACNDQNCIPPTKETFNLKGTAKIAAAKVADTLPKNWWKSL